MGELDLTEAIEAGVATGLGDLFAHERRIAEAAVRAAAPIIERAVLTREARRLLSEGQAHEERYGVADEAKWDRGFAAGMERAAHSLVNDADRETA